MSASDSAELRVLCVIDWLGIGGGAERLIVSLVPELGKRNVRVEVVDLFGCHNDIGVDLERQGFFVHRFNLPKRRFGFLGAIPRLRRLARDRAIDLIWGNLYIGNLCAMLAGVAATPSVIALHSPCYAEVELRRLPLRLRVLVEQQLGRLLPSGRVAVSHAVARDYEHALGWSDIDVIHNGIPAAALAERKRLRSREEVRTAYGLAVNDFVLVVPSRYCIEKGHAVLLEAARLLARKGTCPKIVCVGHGPLATPLREKAAALGLTNHTRFLGLLAQNDLFDLQLAADAVVLPSLREPFGIAAAEAMALGVPTILSRVDGLIEVAGESGAVLFEAGNADALANAILSLQTDRELQSQIARAGQERVVKLFDIGVCAQRWADLFVRLAPRAARASMNQAIDQRASLSETAHDVERERVVERA